MMMKRFFNFTLLALLVTSSFGCAMMGENGDDMADDPCTEGTWLGALTGGLLGGGSGWIMENNDVINGLSAGESALAGAAGGALLGAMIGDYLEDECMEGELDRLRSELAAAQGRPTGADPAEVERLRARIRELEELLASGRGIELERYVLPTDILFAEGRANLTDDGRYKLDMVLSEIRDQYPNMFINVEGHTDIQPIVHSNWKSNWELGAARALAVLHYLEDNGVTGERLSATTYSYYQPAVPHQEGGNQENRRSEIVVYSRTPGAEAPAGEQAM